MNSEVAWLFLLAYWVAGFVIASFFYALWNHGVFADVKMTEVRRSGASFPAGVPDDVVRDHAFELDMVQVEGRLFSNRGTRGPIRASGKLGSFELTFSAGLVTQRGVSETRLLGPVRRGPLSATGWIEESGDPLGLFSVTRRRKDGELAAILPRFASLHERPLTREVEAAVTAPRAGSGSEIFGVREYRPGDALRRIHWRSTARRGELIVREFEPPGVQNLGIFLDPGPVGAGAADQIARIAASEAWDCLRAGGRVTLWAPGCEPTRPDEERNLLALLEWLARYPKPAAEDQPPPIVGDAIAVTSRSDPRLLEAVEDVRAHGGAVRAWVVGEAVLDSDVELERAGLAWPL